MKYFEKIAKDEPGWWAKQTAAGRAARDTGKGINDIITSKEYQKDYYSGMWKGVGPGAAVGVVPGAITGAALKSRFGRKAIGVGAAIGGILGADVGATIGAIKGQKKYYAKKGITVSNLGNVKKMTPEAKAKYLSEKYEGGGYKG
jgi:phage tail tape-measure protein